MNCIRCGRFTSNELCDRCLSTCTECADCGAYVPNDELHETCNGQVCASCADSYTECPCCNEMVPSDNLTDTQDGPVCYPCHDGCYSLCEHCHEYAHSDTTQTVDGDTACERCVDEDAATCWDCDRLSWIDDMYTIVTGAHVCESCRDQNYRYCEDCGDLFHIDDMSYSERDGDWFCSDCYESEPGGSGEMVYYEPPLRFFTLNNQWTRKGADRYLGVELESDGGDADDIIAKLSADFESWLFWMPDGSLSEAGCEVVTHPHTVRALVGRPWDALCRALVSCGYRGHDLGPDKAGIHVHISRDLSEVAELALAAFVYSHVPQLQHLGRRKSAAYCNWLGIERDPKEAYETKKSTRYTQKYTPLHFAEHTIEFRFFRSSLRPQTVVASFLLVDALCAWADGYAEGKNDPEQLIGKNSWPLFYGFVRRRRLYAPLVEYMAYRGLAADGTVVQPGDGHEA